MSKKKILFYSGSLVVLLIVVFAIVHLMKGKETNADNPEFAEYITAYSYGVISKADPIQIHLTGDVVAAMNEKKKQPESLFEFSPSIDGKYEMKGNVVEFTPEKSLPSGKSFYTQFKLGKLIDIKKSLKSFNFKFETIEQELDFEVTEQVTTDLKELKYQQLKGVVSTADIENAESISSILVAKYKRDELNVKWESGIDGLTHFFTIDSIKRTKDDHEIKLKVDGGKIGAAQDISKKINIPGFQNFELINSKVYNEPEQFLELQFSDPIQPNQNLDGLIRIKGINNPRFVINANTISVYTSSHIEDTRNITVSGSIKNVLGYKIGKDLNFAAAFTELKPEINFLGEGNILPSSKKGMLLAFEAVNLKAVDVAVIKIHENNILQFLQSNDYDGSYRLRYVGKPIAMETIQLDQFGIKDLGVKNTFHLDLNKITETEPGAIYRIVLKVKKEYSLYSCALSDQEEEEEDEFTYPKEINWDEYENEFGYRYYYWRDRDDACKEAYYYELKKGKNILTSNLGLIAKKGKDNSLNVFVTDIHEAGPKEGVSVEIYDYQKQLIANAKTDKDGKVTINDVKDAQFAVAKLGTQKGYIKLADNEALNLSKFEVAGKLVNKGLKGYIYEERGVRRPGDSIYLTFVLNQENAKLPANHPMKLELKNSRGNILKTERRELNSTGFYTFRTRTEPDAPTGNYVFTVELGALKFSKIVKVETIKPNRLSIKLDFENKYITEGDGIDARITAKWLHGATAKNMRVKTDMTLMPQKTEFTKFSTFVFDDPVKSFNSKTERIYEGTTNDEGVADIKARVYAKEKAPGMLTASFTTKVFEKSGNFSINKSVKAYSPYNGYLGMTTPETDDYKYYYDSGEPVKCEFVTVTPDGKLDKSNRKIEFQFYKLNWRWWWNSSRNRISSYSFRNSAKLIKRETKISSNGKITWNVETEDDHWGRYLVWAKDTKTGHSTGKIIYFSWPYRSDGNQNKEGASMLVFNTDKEKYAVGDKVKVTFPSNNKGNALVSIENGTKSIKSFWTKTEKGTTEFSFKVTEDMHPNAYIHITLLQEYMQTANDLPIRMYGVMPLNVEDKNTILNPVIEMPKELRSEQTVSIKVSEKNNNPMTYTLAVVDEGLLGLTNFKTPNPADEFFAKEALGVRTWDIFNLVIGAQKGKAEHLLSIGGGANIDREQKQKAKRFKPVVKFLGPFTLQKGSKTHTIKIPKYIGAVRTMVVAGNNTAYGSAEKTTPVIKPLMVTATLPRVLRPKEKLKLPVTLFAMKDNIKSAKVTITTDKYIKVIGSPSQTVSFTEDGEQNIAFDIEVLPVTGIAKVKITAVSGKEKSTEEIEIDVENPNPVVNQVYSEVTEHHKKWKQSFELPGIKGTNKAVLEVSSIPAINLDSRLKYLIRYPHGCIEQVTSSVFPQLFLANITKLTSEQKSETEHNIKTSLKKYSKFQLTNGGFSYWQGGRDASLWGTNYAGHFLIEANKRGYPVNPQMISKWRDFQSNEARNWTDRGPSSQLMQAYRLYTLALSGKPERSSMNRLKSKSLSTAAKWRLAAAYYISGKRKTAEKLTHNLSYNIASYRELFYTYGSDLRDQSMILETMTLTNDNNGAFKMLKTIAAELSSDKYFSTQTTAYALVAISAYIDKFAKSKSLKFSYAVNGKTKEVNINKTIAQIELNLEELKTYQLKFENRSKGVLYASVLLEGKPDIGKSVNESHDLSISVNYKLPGGERLSPDRITQGTDFIAEVSITNPGSKSHYHELALSQMFPSGWEIINSRMYDYSYSSSSPMDYQDIRDDRVYTYFDLRRNKSVTYTVMLNASYVGKFWLPPVHCEAMYDPTISASQGGKFVEVIKM